MLHLVDHLVLLLESLLKHFGLSFEFLQLVDKSSISSVEVD
jgi:hypothetical protein